MRASWHKFIPLGFENGVCIPYPGNVKAKFALGFKSAAYAILGSNSAHKFTPLEQIYGLRASLLNLTASNLILKTANHEPGFRLLLCFLIFFVAQS